MPKPKAVKFQVLHRDARDPLVLDDGSSNFVLHEIATGQNANRRSHGQRASLSGDGENALDTMDGDDCTSYCPSEAPSMLAQTRIKLPKSVLPSAFEETSGFLARNELITGAISLAPDDVQAALLGPSDDEFDELEDDFVGQAMQCGSDDDISSEYDSSIGDISEYDGEELVRIGTDSEGSEEEEWVDELIARPGLLGDMDSHFDQMILQYESDEIGELDNDVGGVVRCIEDDVLDEFITIADTKYSPSTNSSELDHVGSVTRAQIQRQLLEDEGYDSQEDNLAIEEECRPKEREQWDCESILSTRSNMENHPRLIKEPRKKPSKAYHFLEQSIPEELENCDEMYQEPYRDCTGDTNHVVPGTNLGLPRPPSETANDKRARKQAVRQVRQARRTEKKASKTLTLTKQQAHSKDQLLQRIHNPSLIRF